ncbi:MAG: flippase-like domain-containing protein [Chloroflexi bacterium]|nr:flippase-like domain-containing protein [Chloroflexota bacterium]
MTETTPTKRTLTLNWKKIWNWGRLILGVGGLGIVVYSVSERDALVDGLLKVNLWWVLVALLLNFGATLIKTGRWWLVLQESDIPNLKPSRLLGTYLVGMFFSQFMPGSSMGGDAMRMVEMSADSGKAASSVASVMIERVVGMLTILGTASLILLVTSYKELSLTFELAMHFLSISGIIALFVLRMGWFVEPFAKLLTRFKMGKIAKQIVALSEALQSQLGRGRVLFYMVLLSFLANAMTMTGAYLVLVGFGETVPYFAFIPLMCMAVAVELIPLSPGALGLREATYVAFLTGFLGVAESASLGTALVVRAISMVHGVIGGLILVSRGISANQRGKVNSNTTAPSTTS